MLIDNSSVLNENTDVTTKEGWEKYIQSDLEWARNYTIELGGEMFRHQISILCEVDPKTCEPLLRPQPIIMVPVIEAGNQKEEDKGKELFYTACRGAALVGHAIAAVSIAEAWMSHGTKEDIESGRPRVRPKNDPNRKEGLIFLAEHREFGSSMYTAMIETKDGQRTIGEWVKAPSDAIQGAMTALVPPRRIYDDPGIKPIIEAAREIIKSDAIRWSN